MASNVPPYRIHYPLPLPYVGKPDPVHLQDMNRKLKEEIKNLKNQLTKEAQSYQAEQKQKQLSDKTRVEKCFCLLSGTTEMSMLYQYFYIMYHNWIRVVCSLG